jgi:hypothetical protein
MIKITDLYYLENTSENDLIFGGNGGAVAVVGANASAIGEDTVALTETDLNLTTKNNSKLNLKGKATALAVGNEAIANTYYYVSGFTKVKTKTKSKDGDNYDYEILKIKAKT